MGTLLFVALIGLAASASITTYGEERRLFDTRSVRTMTRTGPLVGTIPPPFGAEMQSSRNQLSI
jgi:hypothetical protein